MPLQGKVPCYLQRKGEQISSGSTIRLKHLKNPSQTLPKPNTIIHLLHQAGKEKMFLALKHLLPIPLTAPFTWLRFAALSSTTDIKIAQDCPELSIAERVKTTLGHKILNTISGKNDYYVTGKYLDIKKIISALGTTWENVLLLYLQEAEDKYLLQEPPQS